MRQKTDKEQFVDIVGMYYDIIIIKNNSSEVSGSCYGFFLQVLVSSATLCILTTQQVNKKVGGLKNLLWTKVQNRLKLL